MRPYETLVVLSNELGSGMPTLVERLESIIKTGGGTLDTSHDWGSRRLAYPIKKQADGHYYLLEYNAEPPVVSELERTLRITDGVLRYMTIQQEHTGLPQARPREAPHRQDVPMHELTSDSPSGGPAGRDAGTTTEASSAESAAKPSPPPAEPPSPEPGVKPNE